MIGIERLKSIPFFKDVPDDVLRLVIPHIKHETYTPGEVIFIEGSAGDRFFIVISGEVEIKKAVERGAGEFKAIAVLGSGEFFGEMAMFLNEPRTADAAARSAVEVISLSRGDLLELCSGGPETVFKVMVFFTSALMQRLKNTTRELVSIYESGRVITRARSVMELSDCSLSSVFDSVEPSEAALFVIWNEFNAEFEVRDLRGFDMEPGMSILEDDPLIRWFNANREPIISFDVEHDGRLGAKTSGGLYDGRSMMAAPFYLHDRLLGFMAVLNRTNRSAFSYNHLVLLSAIGGYVSVALENLQHMQSELDRARLNQGKSSIRPLFG